MFQLSEKLAYPVFKPSEFHAASYSIRRGRVKRTTRVERDDVSQERFCQGISRVAEKRYTPCKRANWYVSTATRFYKAIRYYVGIRNAFIPSKEYLR